MALSVPEMEIASKPPLPAPARLQPLASIRRQRNVCGHWPGGCRAGKRGRAADAEPEIRGGGRGASQVGEIVRRLAAGGCGCGLRGRGGAGRVEGRSRPAWPPCRARGWSVP